MELKYGVTFLPTRLIGSTQEERKRSDTDGAPFSTPDRAVALRHASQFPSSCDARIVKITTRPKGWQPTTSKPEIGEVVLIRTIDGSAFMMTGYRDDCSVWRSMPTLRQVPGTVTHWRRLPKPPKDTQR